jgi:hypothetical protein
VTPSAVALQRLHTVHLDLDETSQGVLVPMGPRKLSSLSVVCVCVCVASHRGSPLVA